MKADSILATIGETPHLRVNRLYDPRVEVWMKLERANPGGSIKDRIALAMVEDAEVRGILGPGSVIIEPTSGNTGIGLALVAAVKGYRLILTMPESMSIERRKLMRFLGARVILTPASEKGSGMLAKAKRLEEESVEMYNRFANQCGQHGDSGTKKLFEDIAKRFDDRTCGYTQIYKYRTRRGDGAPLSLIEFVKQEK